ncbi:zeta-crystallin/quinone reductase (NADPH) [Histoplasma capsulatum]|uniref:Zeta-crystallin/quinone reductase (NADPH) n=1 Tax=Ajellomyces capsulatus TaxID=5037 RepID=A0A8A1LZH9_AJECA|nr:quinone oxidoreductase [Histoplasma mississippiense (nom. inval.)]EDN04162.1 quinone oxidoreductase [Histoplasma mississippiense (nom. inval.)]QSS59269.1 zeta-crystallin/quinone reductase (NADPH) [Histoplasma capsulatum]
MASMRAIDIKGGKGPAANLFINIIPKPLPVVGEALVKIKAFGLNRMDLLQREGMYPVPPQAPKILGVEFSGVIESLGDGDCLDFKVGDEVFGLAYGGAYAEYISSSVQTLLHKPAELSWIEAAGIPETWFTAAQAMYLVGEFKPGKSILWHAGASAVSISGIQLSKADNASNIYVTAGSQEKIDFCVKEVGATTGFNYKTQDWVSELNKVTNGHGVDVIVDFVGASYFQRNLDVAAKDGRIVNLGFLGGTKLPAGIDISPILRKRLRYEGSSLRSRDIAYQRQLRDLLLDHAMPKFREGTFKIYVERVFPFEKVIDAHLLMESNQTKGKIICTITEN